MTSILAIIVILLLIGGGIWSWPLVAAALGISSVTDRPGALKHITQLMNTYDISLSEIETAIHELASADSTVTRRSKRDIAKTLFAYLGAIFILAGISTYIAMFWNSMGGVMRVICTLGVGYVLLIVLVSALHENKYPRLILPLTLATVFMMTGGWFVLVHEVFPQSNNWRAAVLFVFGVMAVHQGVLFAKYRRTVLVFSTLFFVYGFLDVGFDLLGVQVGYVAIVLGASLFLVGAALEKTHHRVLAEPALLIAICWLNSGLFNRIAEYTSYNWASLITGLCVGFAAYGMQKAERYPRLIALGYFVGSIMAYVSLFDLVDDTPIELLFFAVTASMLYACIVLQSRALLLTTVIAMLSFIGYFSGKHFANSLGWPITLVLMGVAFLGVGAIAIKVKQRI
jgi:hypothetical protein